MRMSTIKYFSTLIVLAAALVAGWMLWNYYMQSPWTRDGKIRAEQIDIAPQISGRIVSLDVTDNQFVTKGTALLSIDEAPFRIALNNADAQLAKVEADLEKALNEAHRRHNLPAKYIAAEDMESADLQVKTVQAQVKAAQAERENAAWQLSQTTLRAPADGWITNLSTRVGDYATQGKPLFALIDSHSFYVIGYFEETKLRHIHPGSPVKISLYSNDQVLNGKVASIGRAIYDQSVEESSELVPNIKPSVPWVRLAQRVPVRISLDTLPAGLTLVSGTTCTVQIER